MAPRISTRAYGYTTRSEMSGSYFQCKLSTMCLLDGINMMRIVLLTECPKKEDILKLVSLVTDYLLLEERENSE